MLHFVLGCAGSGKTQFIYDKIKQLYNNGNSNIILLVPEQASFETEKDMLDLLSEKGQYSVDVLSFTRLCDRLQAEYCYEQEECLNDIGRRVLMSAALKECEGGLELFNSQSGDSAFSETLLSFYEQMKTFQLTTEELADAAAGEQTVLGGKLRDISMIFSAYESRLSGQYYDPSDRLTRAADILDKHSYFAGKTVFVEAFKGFTEQQYQIIERIIKQSEDCVFTFSFDRSRVNNGLSPFSNISKLIKRLKDTAKTNSIKIAPEETLSTQLRLKSDELRFLEQNFLSDEQDKYDLINENVTVFECQDVYEEADFVAKEIHRLVREDGYRFRDFAVVARNIDDCYQPLIAAFERRCVPYYADRRRPAADKAIFKFARNALKSARTLSTDDIISMLKTGAAGLDEKVISELENYTDIWQIKHGWDISWNGSFSGLNKPNERDMQKLQDLNKIRETVFKPLKLFSEQLSASTTAEHYCRALYNYIEKMNAGGNIYSLSERMKSFGDIDLAEDEVQAYEAFIGVLEQIYMSVGENEMTQKEFKQLFDSAVKACDIGEIPHKLDEAVIGAADRIRPKSPKVTFILETNYGIFPRIQEENTIFTKAEFDKLSLKGCKLCHDGVDEQTDERFLAYTLLCSPSEKLYVSYSRHNRKGQDIEPSEIIEQLNEMFNCNPLKHSQIENECDALRIVAKNSDEYTAACVERYYESKNENYKVNSLKNSAPVVLTKSTAERCFGDNIVLSSSKIDVYHQCRFRYLCEYVLKLKPIKTAAVDVMERGTIVHFVLEKTVDMYSAKPQIIAEMSDDELSEIVCSLVDDGMEIITQGRVLTKVENYSKQKLVKMLTMLVRRLFDELSNTDFKVKYTELAIGKENDTDNIPAYELFVDDKRKIIVTGVIDRTDIFENNNGKFIRITDYKTGEKKLRLSDVVKGHNIQMLLYMIAIVKHMRQTDERVYPAGMYYMPAKIGYASDENSPEKIEHALNEKQRSNGITIDAEDVVNAMDKTETLKFLPVTFSYGTINKENFFNERQFELLTNRIEQILKDMGNGLFFNNYEAEPVSLGVGRKTVCDYCDYRSVCGREKTQEAKVLESKKNSEILSELEAKEVNIDG